MSSSAVSLSPRRAGTPLRRTGASTSDVTRFVLLSTQRSGTSWLMERLAAHPAIGSYGELLLSGREGWPDWPPGANDRPFFATYLKNRGAQPSSLSAHLQLFRFLDYLYEPRRDFRTIGFKLMYNEATPYPEILSYLCRRRVRVLHLLRANLLDIALSQMGTGMRKFSHAWRSAEKEDIRIYVNTRTLLWWLRKLERDRRIARLMLRTMRLDVYEVTYEDLLTGDAPLHAALKFIGIPTDATPELPATMMKLAPLSHTEGIANFRQVEACLRGSRFYCLLRP